MTAYVAGWPASLPQTPRRGSYTGGPRDERVTFTPDAGPDILRAAVTAEQGLFEAQFPNLDPTQVAAWEAFVRVTLRRGTLPFAWRDPVTDQVWVWRLARGERLYDLSSRGARLTDLTVRLVRLPGPPWWTHLVPPGLSVAPRAAYDFAGNRYHDGIGFLPFGDALSFARASAALAVDATSGLLVSAGNDVPRFDFEPVGLTRRGLLVEPAATNQVTRSQELELWTQQPAASVTVTPNAFVAPDGTTTAEFAVPTTDTNGHRMVRNQQDPMASTIYTASAFVRSGGASRVRLSLRGSGYPNDAFVIFNLTQITAPTIGADVLDYGIENWGNNWRRIWITVQTRSTGDVFQLGLSPRFTNTDGDYAGDGTSGTYFWGADVKEGAMRSSHLPTAGSTVARAADLPGITRPHGLSDVRVVYDDGSATVLTGQTLTAGWWPSVARWSVASVSVFEPGALA